MTTAAIMDAPSIDTLASLRAPAPPQRTTGALDVVLKRRGDATAIAGLWQEGCAKARMPRDDQRGLPDVTLINLAGGLTGGDRLKQRLVWREGTAAGATTQAAEKIYRAAAGCVRLTTKLRVADGAWAEWLPQETILFDGAALDRRLRIELAPGARLLAVEPVVFGRLAMGERVRRLHWVDRIELRFGGRLAWVDVNRIAGAAEPMLDRRALGDGARALVTILYAGADAGERLKLFRSLVEREPVTGGASLLSSVVVSRLHHPDPAVLRRAVATVVAEARGAIGGWPIRLPRAWHV